MRRAWLILLAAGLSAAAIAASIAVVPVGSGAWCRGAYLGPGVQLKAPFARVSYYSTEDQELALDKTLIGSEAELLPFELVLAYRWDFLQLPDHPIDPESLHERLHGLLRQLDRGQPRSQLGASAEREIRSELSRLPLQVLKLSTTYPTPAVIKLQKAARPTGQQVVAVGFDGLDWVLLDRLIDEGRCPTFAGMKRNGAWGEIVSRPPVLSPLIWTTIASGQPPEVHGVVDFVVTDPVTGKDVPITNQSRQVHAFWNILSYIDIKVHVVNWWATYPAEPINGVMVSERVFYQLFGIRPALDDPANISPPELAEELLPLLVAADDIELDEVRSYAEIDRVTFDQALEDARRSENPFDNRINHLRKIIAVTRGVFSIGHWLLEQQPADLTVLYVEGTDTIGHRFAHFLPPKLDWVSQADFDAYSETMARYYEECDRSLAELMKIAPADTTWLVVTDHGFYTGKARPSVRPDDFTLGAPQWHRMVGAFLATGPDVRPGKIPYIHIEDLCRTLLWLIGAPISDQLQGREVVELMQPEWVEAHPPARVAGYAQLPRTWLTETKQSSTIDEARIRELQALGYITTDEPQVQTTATTESPSTAPQTKVTEPYNLAKMAIQRGDLEEAEQLFLKALELKPDFAIGMYSLAGLYSTSGEHEQALRWTLRALETGDESLPPSILLQFVREARAVGRLNRVLPALEMIRQRWQHTSAFYTARAQVLLAMGDIEAAEAELRTSLAKNPADPVATEEMLKLAGQDRSVDTDAVLRQHMDAVKHDLMKLNELAVICLRQGRPLLAEQILKQVLVSDPSNVGVASNLAVALQQQGKSNEAAAILESSVMARPDDLALRFNLAAVLASLGRNQQALDHLDEAEQRGLVEARLYVARSKVLVRMGKLDEARESLELGARRHPGHPEIKELLAALDG
jgi:predicted AlkP superfamily phosphohydrolase/phosphomutase/Tfp pilus assembly protein PilF